MEKEKDYEVECDVCGQVYKNWVGSTPCCGSIAFRLDENGNKTYSFMVYAEVVTTK